VAEIIKVWQCVGCGRIDDPRPCVGVCRDQKVEYVLASEHRAELALGRTANEALRDIVRRIALTTPRAGEAASTYRALQQQARRVLAAVEGGA
jgi:hypothetical protein